MRIWDIPVECLCRNHLLAEHRELHAIWNTVVESKSGYSKHPETQRWSGRLRALWKRHEEQVAEMSKRGYAHRSPLDVKDIPRRHRGGRQTVLLITRNQQLRVLKAKGCACRTEGKLR